MDRQPPTRTGVWAGHLTCSDSQWSLHCMAKWGIPGTEGSPFLPLFPASPAATSAQARNSGRPKCWGAGPMPRRGAVTAEDTLCPLKVTSSPHTPSLGSGSRGAGWGVWP